MALSAQDRIKRQQKFYEIYKKEVLPKLLPFEVERKRILSRIAKMRLEFIFKKLFFLFFISLGAFIAIFNAFALIILVPILFYAIIYFIVLFFKDVDLYKEQENKVKKEYKNKLKKCGVNNLLKAFPDIKHVVFGGSCEQNNECLRLNSLIINNSKLFSSIDKMTIDDEFCGIYEGIRYNVSEINLLDFQGLIFLFDFPKNTNAFTIVSTSFKKEKNSFSLVFSSVCFLALLFVFILAILKADVLNCLKIILCAIAIITSSFSFCYLAKKNHSENSQNDLQKTILEDSKFNKNFYTQAQNQIEARYILTPSFMERVLMLKKAFDSVYFKLAFFDNYLLIALPSKEDFFELGDVSMPLDSVDLIKKFNEQICLIFDIIEQLKLMQKTKL